MDTSLWLSGTSTQCVIHSPFDAASVSCIHACACSAILLYSSPAIPVIATCHFYLFCIPSFIHLLRTYYRLRACRSLVSPYCRDTYHLVVLAGFYRGMRYKQMDAGTLVLPLCRVALTLLYGDLQSYAAPDGVRTLLPPPAVTAGAHHYSYRLLPIRRGSPNLVLQHTYLPVICRLLSYMIQVPARFLTLPFCSVTILHSWTYFTRY